MASLGGDLGFNRYSLGDLYGGVRRQSGLKDYGGADDNAALIAALIASGRTGLGQMGLPMPRGPQVPTAQVPVAAMAPGARGGMPGMSAAPAGSGNVSIQQLKDIYDKLKGSPSSAMTGTGAPPGSGVAQPIDLSAVGSAGLGKIGAGAMFGTSGSAALGATAPIAGDAALANLGTATAGQMFGTSASAAAGAGPGSLGAAGGAGGLGYGTGAAGGSASGAGSAATGAGLGSIAGALGTAAFMSGPALGGEINAALGLNKNSDAFRSWYHQITGGDSRFGNIGGRTPMYKLPDGTVIRSDDRAATAAKAYMSGDMNAYNAAYADMVAHAVRKDDPVDLRKPKKPTTSRVEN